MNETINQKFETLMWKTLEKYTGVLDDFPKNLHIPESDADVILTFRLIADINNGGFLQFFCNWGYHNYTETMQMLEKVWAQQHREILQSMYACIADMENDPRIQELFDIYQYISAENETKLQTLDEAFWNWEENLEALVYAYHFPEAEEITQA